MSLFDDKLDELRKDLAVRLIKWPPVRMADRSCQVAPEWRDQPLLNKDNWQDFKADLTAKMAELDGLFEQEGGN